MYQTPQREHQNMMDSKSSNKSNKSRLRYSSLNNSNDEWVFVQKGNQATLEADDIMVVPESPSPTKKFSNPIQVTRELSDTMWSKVYQRPIPHNFGNANCSPATESNYMKTFNVKVLETPGGENQVYLSARNALARRNMKDDLIEKATATKNPAPETHTSASSPESTPREPVVFGKKNKPRSEEPSMFDILSWPDA